MFVKRTSKLSMMKSNTQKKKERKKKRDFFFLFPKPDHVYKKIIIFKNCQWMLESSNKQANKICE